MVMPLADWAEPVARHLLKEPLPRRLAHTRGVARAARTLAPILGEDADLLHAAAWLHDIGYSPALAITGLHQLDGARHLRNVEHADDLLCRLVAHHTCAMNEAEQRGLAEELAREFTLPPPDLADALIYCDMTTGPDGQDMPVARRLAEITERYGPDDLVSHAITRSAPELTAAVERVTLKLDNHERSGLTDVRAIAALKHVGHTLPHRPVHLIARYVAGLDPARLGGLAAHRELAARGDRGQHDRELLPDLAVAGVQDHVPRVGVDPRQAGDLALDAALLPRLADRGLGQRLADVDAAAG